MKITVLLFALVTSITINVAIGAKSSESIRFAFDLPRPIPPIKPNPIVITPLSQSSSLA